MKLLPPIERVHRPSVEQLRAEYLGRSRPVLITGLLDDWPDVRLLAPEDMRATYGSLTGTVRHTDDEFEFFFGPRAGLQREMTLAAYIDAISAWRPGDPRPPYFGNISLTNPPIPELARLRGVCPFPPYCQTATDETRLWIGAAGQRSTIHNDPYSNLNAQVSGQKAFLLFHPRQHFNLEAQRIHDGLWVSPIDPEALDSDRHPGFASLEAYSVVLSPGETLFIPMFWWHQARSVTLSVNINNWFTSDAGFWSPLRAQRFRT
jgi:lysine-specific demethylase 8